MSVIEARNAVELASALTRAAGGDTVLLTGDDYGDFSTRRINPIAPVIIKSDDVGGQATFRTINVSDSSNLIFDSIKVQLTPEPEITNTANLVRIYRGTNIELRNSVLLGFDATTGVSQEATTLDASGNVIGLPVGRGMWVHQSNGVTITNNEMTNLAIGLALVSSENLRVTDNEIHDLRNTGIQAGGVSNLIITGNHLHTHNPWSFGGSGDHGDYIHVWSTASERAENSGIKISGNLIEQGEGKSVLGIYVDDNKTGVGFEDVEITHNVIMIGEHQAIRLENVHGIVGMNTLIQTSGTAKENPLIHVTNGSDINLINNIAGGYVVNTGSTVVQSGNLIVQGQVRNDNHYDQIFKFDASDGINLSDVLFRDDVASGYSGTGANLVLFQDWLGEATPQLQSPVSQALGSALADMMDGQSRSTAMTSALEATIYDGAAQQQSMHLDLLSARYSMDTFMIA